MMLATFQWTVDHSPALRGLIQRLRGAEPKARFRLLPSLDPDYGSLRVTAQGGLYEMDILVSTLGWIRCGDALEPWIASAVFLALETAARGGCRETSNPLVFRFTRDLRQEAFAFQAQVREEAEAADPGRLKGLPDGALLFRLGFRPGVYPPGHSREVPRYSLRPTRRRLPAGQG